MGKNTSPDLFDCYHIIKGCDSNFELKLSQILKVASNEKTTLHLTICTRIAL